MQVFRRWKELGKVWPSCFNDVCHSAVIDFGFFSSKVLWIKFRFSRVKVCVVIGYGHNEGNGEESERFWNDLDKAVDRVGNG